MHSTGVPGNWSEISAVQMVLYNIISAQELFAWPIILKVKKMERERIQQYLGEWEFRTPVITEQVKSTYRCLFFGLPSFSNVIIRLQRGSFWVNGDDKFQFLKKLIYNFLLPGCSVEAFELMGMINNYRQTLNLPSVPPSCALCTVAEIKVILAT